MSRKVTLLLFAVHLCLLNTALYVAATLTSNPNSTNGTITVCPGVPISITCTHENTASGVTRWTVTGNSNITTCTEAVTHNAMPPDDTCGVFTITMISGSSSPTIFTSTAQTDATEALNGAVVECFSSGLDTSLIGNITIDVLGIPTPDLSIEQVSQSMVRASLSVADTQCVASYQVDATPTSGPVSTSSNTDSTFDITGLNVCENNYTLAGSVLTAGGVQSALNSPVSFTANLSVVNGITVTINTMDPLIEWTQTPNPLYPTCITGYMVTDQGNPSLTTTVDSATRSLTAQQLNAAGFPYCISIHPTVTPLTPMGPLTPAMGSFNLYANLIDPDFPIPMVADSSFALVNQSENETGVVVLRVRVQTLSESEVPTRSYRYTNLTGSLSPVINFTGDMFEIALPGVDGGHVVNVNVMFESGPCTSSAMGSFIVPERNISNVTLQIMDTSLTVTLTLPLTPYQPEELIIKSSVEPSNGNPIMSNFSGPGMQYSVTFDDLDPDTSYTLTVWILLRADNTSVEHVARSFTTLMTPTTPPPPTTMAPTTTTTPSQTPSRPTGAPVSGGCTGGCIAGIIIGFLVVVVLVVVIIAILCYWSKTRKSGVMKVSSSHEMEQQSDKLTPSPADQVDPRSDSPPTGTFKNADAADPAPDKSPDVIPGEQVDSGPDSAALIYADLDMATKGKNKAKVTVSTTPTGGADGIEAVEYASIDHFKKAEEN